MTFDPSTFAARDPRALQKQFLQRLAPAFERLGKSLSKDEVRECLMQAGLSSGWGRFVLGNNYWMLPGRGDAGSFLLVRVASDPTSVSGLRPIVEKYAKFSNLDRAIAAWRQQRVKR